MMSALRAASTAIEPAAILRVLLLGLVVPLWIGSPAAATDQPIRIELNTVENAQNRCRLSFVIENKGESPVDTLKLDLAVFARDGAIRRRLIADMGPLRRGKTIVKTFDIEVDCAQIGSILVNDVTTCAPEEPGACLDRLTLSSRLPELRFFK
jgi:hypothetical protein